MAETNLDELKAANKELLDEIDAKGEELKTRKEQGASKDEINELGAALTELKFKLPVELMSERDAKQFLKLEAKKQKEAEKAARAAKWESQAKSKDSSKKKKKGAPEPTETFVNTTPPGEKKDMTGPMAKAYNPAAVESAWDAWWESQGYYSTDVDGAAAAKPEEKFVIVIPPPNVTGSLHIGHALTCSIEDTLCRWNRMCGKYVMWLPGTDHAGIATQAVVEKRLMKEQGLTKHDLGREKFLDEVWKWKNEKGAHILTQLRRLGASVDHSRTVFTMDEKRSKCVTEAFVRMHDAGLLYREKRLVNWSSALNTALSDIEVDHVELTGLTLRSVKGHDPNKEYEFGTLTSFAYKLADSEGKPLEEEIVVATTRLETMLGDTAVAVNPDDPRYKHLHGKHVVHPFRNCTIPIITDGELVDMNFGTGAVKITPAHDPNDFRCGRQHGLEMISILNDNGSINGVCGAEFEGMMRFDARYFVEDKLKELGLFRDKQPHVMKIPICSRSGDVIEPRLVPQWWVSCKSMADRAVALVRSKELKLVPEFHERTWFGWLENIQDWCISRQLWWGHRIPAYRVKGTETSEGEAQWFVGRDEAEARAKAAAALGRDGAELELEQDPDVLDTWFSSGLFPFSTFGWAHEDEASQKELDAFFPGTLLETGHDIIFFWVARMVMMSLQLMDKLPFDTVYLHAMVRDKYGRKMSKSLGNVLDPIQVMEGITLEELNQTLYTGNLPEKEIAKAIEGQRLDYPDGIPECGADALRFGLLAYTVQGRDVNLDINRVAAYRRFCNKLWQVTNFMMLNLGDAFAPAPTFLSDAVAGKVAGLALRDRWILSKLASTAIACNDAMQKYEFASATQALNKFYLDELCDVYVEAVKPVMRDGSAEGAPEDARDAKLAAQNTLWYCLDVALRLMHPIMPFVTEELWQRLPGRPQPAAPSIMVAHYPGAVPVALHAGDERAVAETEAITALPDAEADEYLDIVNLVSHGMRSLITSFGVNSKLDYFVKVTGQPRKAELLGLAASDLCVLGRAKSVAILAEADEVPKGCAAGLPDPSIQVFVQLTGVVDPAKEIERLNAALGKVDKQLAALEQRKEKMDKMKEEAKAKLLEDISKCGTERAALSEQVDMFRALAADSA